MSSVTLEQALQMAIAKHRGGDAAGAEAIYRQILAVAPEQVDALHLLAVACRQQGRLDEALPLFERCAKLAPRHADLLTNYGEALLAAGQATAGEQQLRKALAIQPRHPQALNNLGLALQAQGRLEQAVAAGRRAVDALPQHANACNNLGNYLLALGRAADAIEHFHKAQQLDPGQAEIAANLVLALEQAGQQQEALRTAEAMIGSHPSHARLRSNAGRLLWLQQRLAEAIAQFSEALRLDGKDAGTWCNFGLALHDSGQPAEAIAAYRQAIALDPKQVGAWSNLGITLKEQGAISEALAAFEEALRLQPEHAESWSNLGMCLEIAGRASEAVSAYQRAIDLDPQLDRAHSNRIFALNYLPDFNAAMIAAEHRQWAAQHVAHLYPTTPVPASTPVVGRRLRLGLMSPDLRSHPVAYLLQPYLAHYDRQAIEIFIYSDVANGDSRTAELRTLVEHWHDIAGRSHHEVAALVRTDQLDLLVDLAGHSARHRLPVFAMKPAARQASWIGYFNSTGLSSIDYFITDPATTPPELSQHFSERPLYLPESRFCYQLPEYAPPVAPLPALATGLVTFGCFNNLAKLNDQVIAAWSRILLQLPASRLLLKALALGDAQVRADLLARFAEHDIPASRLELRSHSPHAQMLGEYAEVDIALDPFPFSGGMTSCEALCMGVPVLTLRGQTLAGRQSHSLLSVLRLTAWSCGDVDEYVAQALAHSHDLSRLSSLRNELRKKFANSAAGNAAQFARQVDQLWLSACNEK
jgi:predicted O-linked N-acetylglucosamine transferase (SPINDLY family)